MTPRSAKVVILCEDDQQEAFIRQFLKVWARNWEPIRTNKNRSPGGSGEQWVREQFPAELQAHRSREKRGRSVLIVMTDADKFKVSQRAKQLLKECEKTAVDAPRENEAVVIAIPKWSVETWLRYLDGQEFDENKQTAPHYSLVASKKPARSLAAMCKSNKLRAPAPKSLELVCDGFKTLFK